MLDYQRRDLASPKDHVPHMPNAPVRFSEQAIRTHEQPISYFMQQALENPGLISLAAGLVDEPTLPAAEMEQTFAEVFSTPESARSALQYGTTQGYVKLRKRLLDRFAADDGLPAESLALTPDDVIITNGSQQLLYILSEVLLDPGDIVLDRGAVVLCLPRRARCPRSQRHRHPDGRGRHAGGLARDALAAA